MKNKIYFATLFIAALVFSFPYCHAQEIKTLPEFNKDDRILILAPHPDDETIGAGGVIQEALKAGAKVKVACFTNGDHNQWAFIVYEKRITLRKGEFLHMGEVRRKETLDAMSSLGLKQDDILFLGYPDFGTLDVLTRYWGKTKPFRNTLTKLSDVSYPEAMSYKAPYVGESILKDVEKILLDFKPTKIFVSHPADTNRDHQALYLFLQVALWDLESQLKRPEIYPYIIHAVGWPKPKGYHPDLEKTPPSMLTGIAWYKLSLTESEISAKHDAIKFYKTQIKYNPPYLFSFARKDELFGDFPVFKLNKQKYGEASWQDLGTSEGADEDAQKSRRNPSPIITLAYALGEDAVLVKIKLKQEIDKDFGVSVYLLGYSRNKKFADMPKIYVLIDSMGLHIKDKNKHLPLEVVQMGLNGKTLTLRIPLSLLGDPDYMLSRIRTGIDSSVVNETAWRILELE